MIYYFLGNERGISKDLPTEHHWWDIDWIISACKSLIVSRWIISGCKSLLVVIAYCNHKQLDSDKLEGVIRCFTGGVMHDLSVVLSVTVNSKRYTVDIIGNR